jgi:hypothetical protein
MKHRLATFGSRGLLQVLLAAVLLSPVISAGAPGQVPSSTQAVRGASEGDVAVFVYAGQWSANRFGEIVGLRTVPRSSYVGVVGASRRLYSFNEHMYLEGEVNVARHWGRQDHFEINAAASVRWHTFPWDRFVDTSIAHGFGPSYAFERPPIEWRSDHRASRVLVFMVTELAFAPPRSRDAPWEGFIRIHHRSGAYDVVSRSGGSNFLAGGLRYRF